MIRPEQPDRLENLTVRLTAMLGDEMLARRWLHTLREDYGGRTPAELAQTELGSLEIEALLARVEHSVFY